MRKKTSAIGTAHAFEERLFGIELFGQRGAGVFRLVGGLGIDDDQQNVGILRKGVVERLLLLTPRQVGTDQLVDIGVDAEMPDGVIAAEKRRAAATKTVTAAALRRLNSTRLTINPSMALSRCPKRSAGLLPLPGRETRKTTRG